MAHKSDEFYCFPPHIPYFNDPSFLHARPAAAPPPHPTPPRLPSLYSAHHGYQSALPPHILLIAGHRLFLFPVLPLPLLLFLSLLVLLLCPRPPLPRRQSFNSVPFSCLRLLLLPYYESFLFRLHFLSSPRLPPFTPSSRRSSGTVTLLRCWLPRLSFPP